MTQNALELWLQANQRHLADALGTERVVLERYSGNPDPVASPPEALPSPRSPARHGGPAPALETLCATFGLSSFERSLLLWCAGAELDASFGAALAAAQHDPAQRQPSFSLALAALPGAHWSALSPAAPLRYWRMIEPAPAANLAGAALRIDERILHYLTGTSHLDERLTGAIHPLEPPDWSAEGVHALAGRLAAIWRAASEQADLPVVQLSGPDRAARRAVAGLACADLGLGLFQLQARLLPADPRDQEQLFRLWDREALLSGAVLLVDWDDLEPHSAQFAALARLVESTRGALLLSGHNRWPAAERALVSLDVPALSAKEQAALWREELGEPGARLNGSLARLTDAFSLPAPAIRAACAAFDRHSGSFDQLWQACREQARAHLDDLAQRIQSPAGWRDLVLPPLQAALLRQIGAHVRRRSQVYENWGFAARSSRGLGTSAVFSGPSGTGKTLAAEVLANELKLDLYRIDLSAVVSKYIGETEKNLRRLFDAAEDGGAILFFDEADALFGKRSEVKDSHDRYANIEVSYLLQRMEAYRGLSILATNMPEALDTAFLRRIRFVVTFPFPDKTQRGEIWCNIFPAATPLDRIEFDTLADLDVAGGSIYNIALHAAFLAAETGGPVRMAHLMDAARGEYMRLEKPFPTLKGEATA